MTRVARSLRRLVIRLKHVLRGHPDGVFIRNIYGDEINFVGGMRSEWRCSSCGVIFLKPELKNEKI